MKKVLLLFAVFFFLASLNLGTSQGLSEFSDKQLAGDYSSIGGLVYHENLSEFTGPYGRVLKNLSGAEIPRSLNLTPKFVPGEIIVKFKDAEIIRESALSEMPEIAELNERYEAGMQKVFRSPKALKTPLANVYKIKLADNADMQEAISDYLKSGLVEYAEPNYIYRTMAVPNDAKYPEQWAHQNMQSEPGWDTEKGSEDIVIAVIDTGVDYTHEDLGNCTMTPNINGTIEPYLLESPHPYPDDYDYTWSITKSGYVSITVHFTEIAVEEDYDSLYILDNNNNIIQTFTGTYNDVWSASVPGDTIKIRLKSDSSISYYGFKIDRIINGTFFSNLTNCDKIISGYDFVDTDESCYTGEDCKDRDNDPMDFHGHGTHCSGIASAVTNNNIGIAGVCWNCRIMPVRAGFTGGDGYGYLEDDDSAAAIVYAADNNANIISMSWGGYENSSLIKEALDYAYSRGIVLIAAAGNENTNQPLYPAAYDNVIAVAATDENDLKAGFSNHGLWVDVAAPGVDILSTTPHNTYSSWSGTSMATPYVAGLAGLILSKTPGLAQDKVKQIIKTSADPVDSLPYIGAGRINVYKALQVNTKLEAQIAYPLKYDALEGVINIIGTAAGNGFTNYTIDYGRGVYPKSWTRIISSATSKANETLAVWNSSGILDGEYVLRLLVNSDNGWLSEEVFVVIANDGTKCYSCRDCNYKINELGSNPVLSDDIDTCGTCIEIRKNYAVFDCNNHVIKNCGYVADYPSEGYSSPYDIGILSISNFTTIKNCNLMNNFFGVLLLDSRNNIISDNKFTANIFASISLDHSDNNTISNNKITGNHGRGIDLYASSYNKINKNTVFNLTEITLGMWVYGGDGVYLDGHYGRIWMGSEHNLISDNNISYCMDWGIHLLPSVSTNNIISNNTISHNRDGIHFNGRDPGSNIIINNDILNNDYYGILIQTINNTIQGNNIVNNRVGIDLYWWTLGSNRIINNNVVNNSEIGISIEKPDTIIQGNNVLNNGIGIDVETDYTIIYHNNIIDNTLQAYDDGSDNSWDNDEEGNYWNDYDSKGEGCFDANKNGICDSPYVIDSDGQDNYPFVAETGWIIHKIECQENNTIWTDCSDIAYNDYLTAVRVNCTDPDGIKGVYLQLINIPDNYEFFNNNALFVDGYWVYNNSDILIRDSGEFGLTVYYIDNLNNENSATYRWTIPFGVLQPYLISPLHNISVNRTEFFNFSSGIRCVAGECGNVSATLKLYFEESHPITCSEIWGGDCSEGPPETFDNTFDNCNNGAGGDEGIGEIYLNKDKVGFGEEIEVNCYAVIKTLDCGEMGYTSDELYIYYRNSPAGTWQKKYHVSQVYSCYNYSIKFVPDSVEGEHQIRCIIDYNAENDECAGGAYYDNDDANFSVIKDTISPVEDKPFYTISPNPQNPGNLECLKNMKEGDSCSQTWQVKATGGLDESFDFYTLYRSMSYALFIPENQTDEIKITIVDLNHPPQIDSFTPNAIEIKIREGTVLDFNHTSHDVDNDLLVYSWQVDGAEKANSQAWAYSPVHSDIGNHAVKLTVVDPYGASDSQEWNVTVLLDGDVNDDCVVNIFDLATVGLCYGCSSGQACWQNCERVDVKPDGVINIFDLATVGLNYGNSC